MNELDNYLYGDLLPENIYGHTKKVELLRLGINQLRALKGEGLRILDIGCGSGYAVTRFLANSADQIVGIDLHPPSIAFARQNYAITGLEFHLKKAEDLPDAWGKFDAIVMADVLEHIDEPQKILIQARRLLATNGKLLVSIPNGRGPFEIESYIRRIPLVGWFVLILIKLIARSLRTLFRNSAIQPAPEDVPYNAGSPHIHFFSRKQFETLAEKADLEILACRNLSFLCGPYSGELFSVFSKFYSWNRDIADRLPHWAASAWYFELAPKKGCNLHDI